MSGALWYRSEIDLQEIVDEQVRKVQRRVDEATLDKAADTLANFGYVKVNGNSRWAELFGTPERAARTLVDSCNDDYDYGCGGCPVARVNCKCGDYNALLEWLRGDAE